MKKIILMVMLTCIMGLVNGQVPQSFKYQSVVRNTSGDILAKKTVSFKISILGGSPTGSVIYSESHAGKTTNAFGLVDLEIGKGTPVTGTFSSISWGTDSWYLKVEIDPAGGTSYAVMGTSQLLSVPFALYAKEVQNKDDADADPVNELQKITLSGTVLTLDKNGGSVTLPSSGAGGDNWGTDYVHTDVTLSGQGTTASPLKIAQQAATSGQVLKWNGTAWSPASDVSGGGLVLPYSGTAAFASDPVFSITNSGSGSGIKGKSNATSGVYYGVIGESSSTNGTGVYGGAPNTGVEGIAHSGGGTAIYGYAYADKGTNYAIRGVTNSSDGYAGYFHGGKVHISGNTGLGITNPTAKLDIDGQLKIRGGTPGAGKVLTSDTEGLASWQTPAGGGFVLPYSGTASAEGYVFEVKNSGPGNSIKGESSSGTGVFGYAPATGAANVGVFGESRSASGVGTWGNNTAATGQGIGVRGSVQSTTGYSGYFERGRFYIEGNTGIGTLNPGAKLEVAGQVKITGGTPGTGKVLTSDANGLATWQNPGGGLVLPYNTSATVDGSSVFRIQNNGNGDGITGVSNSPSTTTVYSGVTGLTANSIGSGVSGYALLNTGPSNGVYGNSPSSTGNGVFGMATSSTGTACAVKGVVLSNDGFSGHFHGGKFYIQGNTGIGTTSPSQKLHIKGNSAGNAVLLIDPLKWEAAGDYGELRFGDANHSIRGEHTKGMTFNDANKFNFTGGNVGIGMDNPAAKLDVSASQGPNIIIRDSDGGSGRPGIQFVNNDVHFIGSDDTSTEVFGFYSRYGDSRTNAARLNVHGPSSGNWGKYISLTYDGNHGRISTDAGYLVLEPAGQRVGVGTDAPTQSLDVNGTLRVRGMTTGTSAGTVYRTADGTLITGASDIRLKENIEPIGNSLEKVLQLKGVTFTWKNDPEKRKNIGFIAQDFEKVIPELVFTNENDGFKGINYAEVTAILVEAIRELKTDNDLLRDQNSSLSGEISQANEKIRGLNSRLENIEAILHRFAEK